MKTLILFGALVLLGWTAMAAGVIAVFAGEPTVSMQSHRHLERQQLPEVTEPGPLLSNCPNGGSSAPDASVPCSAAMTLEELERTDA